jgi:hypothetical protein
VGDHRASRAAIGPTTPPETDRNWPLAVRRARAADRDAVLSFATRTWDGWDYVPRAWPVWLAATDGVLLVGSAMPLPDGSMPLDSDGTALVPDQPIAVSRIAMLSPTEGWLEGIRVDPRVRGLGVATDMQTAELHWLAAHDPAVIRYATGAQNEGSHRLGARHGIELLARFRTWAWHDADQPSDDSRDEATGFDEATRSAATRRRGALIDRLAAAGRSLAAADAQSWWQRGRADPES